MPNPYVSMTDLDPELAKIQRQQRLADMLQQQAMQDIPTSNAGGIPAPISPFSGLAKILAAYGAKRNMAKADEEIAALQTSRQKGLADMLSKQYEVPGQAAQGVTAPAIAPIQTDIGGQPMSVGGAPADPTQGAIANGTAARPTTTQEQMANALSMMGSTNPMASQLGIPLYKSAQDRQNLDYQHQLGREDKVWENAQPMPVARGQEITAQGQQAQQNATFTNQLPMNAAQRAADQRARDELAETRNYHQSLTGAGIGGDDPVVASHVQNVLAGNETMQNVPARYKNAVSVAMANAPKAAFTPLAATRNTLAATRITAPLMKLPQYELTANGLPYLQRIDAALKIPGSVSDQDLLDSLTKLNTAGNAVTDAQVKIITDGKSFSDWANTIANKFRTGGVLSDDQRKQIRDISNSIYANYKKGYQPVYDQATSQLKAAGIPEAFWTIPDLNKLNAGVEAGRSSPTSPAASPKVIHWNDMK